MSSSLITNTSYPLIPFTQKANILKIINNPYVDITINVIYVKVQLLYFDTTKNADGTYIKNPDDPMSYILVANESLTVGGENIFHIDRLEWAIMCQLYIKIIWSSTITYTTNMTVFYPDTSGLYYISLVPDNLNNIPNSVSPYNSSYWAIIWVASTEYQIGTIVFFANTYYTATSSSTGAQPDLSPNSWSLNITIVWSSTATLPYTINMITEYSSIYYICIYTTIDNTPPSQSPTYWNLYTPIYSNTIKYYINMIVYYISTKIYYKYINISPMYGILPDDTSVSLYWTQYIPNWVYTTTTVDTVITITSTITYPINMSVIYSNATYNASFISLTDNNLNKIPNLFPEYWNLYTPVWSGFVTYPQYMIVYYTDSIYYISNINGNVGNNPSSSSNWTQYNISTWSVTITYPINFVINQTGTTYKSKLDNNLAHDPSGPDSNTYWTIT